MKRQTLNVLDTDVLVIGGGGAGMMAALEASRNGCTATLVDKGIPSRECATLMAKQLAAAGPWSYPADTPEKHKQDTLTSGCFINNVDLVDAFVSQAADTVFSLEEMGMYFHRTPSGDTFLEGGHPPGHSYPRSLFFLELTGKMIVDTLRRNALKKDIALLPDMHVIRLLLDENQIRGAAVWNAARGELVAIKAKAVIVATGGCGQLYPITSNPLQSTGEGYILGVEAGAELMDMEMFQFYPISLVHPEFLRGLNVNIRGKLLNSRMERFMERIDPLNLENVTRDKLSQAVYGEIKKGLTTPHGGVYLDASGFDPDVYEKKYPTEYGYCLEAGFDLKKDLVEIAPAAHFMMGGLKIDAQCRTRVRGLFAAGEAAGGLHGANRLANNALMEIFVFGKIAGQHAREFALQEPEKPLPSALIRGAENELHALQEPKTDLIRGVQLKQRLRRLMWEKVGVIRNAARLEEGIQDLEEINRTCLPRLGSAVSSKTHNRDFVEALEAASMAKLALIIARSASVRHESRGAQYMEDYPAQDNERYRGNVVVQKSADGKTAFKLIPCRGGTTGS